MTHENLYTWLPQLNRTWKLRAQHLRLRRRDWRRSPHLGFDRTTEWSRKLRKPSRPTKNLKRPLATVRGRAKIRQDPGTEWYQPEENVWRDVHGPVACFSLYSLFVSYLYFSFRNTIKGPVNTVEKARNHLPSLAFRQCHWIHEISDYFRFWELREQVNLNLVFSN